MDFRNDLEIRVFHTKRSGGHAIFNWIAHCADRPVLSLNNLLARKLRWRGRRVFRSVLSTEGRDETRRTWGFELAPGTDYRALAAMRKDVLMWNVENVRLDRIPHEPIYAVGGASDILGASRTTKTVLILRDAFNTFASAHRRNRRSRAQLRTFFAPHWKTYAREFLAECSFLPADTVKISYNKWFSSESYRRTVADRLGFVYTERGLDEVRGYGGGSSFDGRAFDSKGRMMNVLDRWRKVRDDPDYLASLDDETIELSNRIFGDVTGGQIAAPRLGEDRATP